jgi:hypothetical protein
MDSELQAKSEGITERLAYSRLEHLAKNSHPEFGRVNFFLSLQTSVEH